MAEGEQDDDQKTEDPSEKRLREAREKGNVAFSREVTSFFMLFTLALTIAWYMPSMLKQTGVLLMPFIANPEDMLADQNGLSGVLSQVVLGAMMILIVPLFATLVAAIAGAMLQNGIIFTSEPLLPKMERVSPLAGFKRLFSMRSVVEFLKSIVKITVVGVVAYLAVAPHIVEVKRLPDMETLAMLLFLSKLVMKMLTGVVIAMFFIAGLDFFYQRFAYMKQMRMSKQDQKDEYKQSEGDPKIKGRLRQLRQERAKQRMMAAVPQSDVVITNPTHFAVALRYDRDSMKAPTVTAKGQDLLALRMRELAKEHEVPIVENPPLARALFTSAEIDEEIPFTHYEAVAKIISYVYQLKGKKF